MSRLSLTNEKNDFTAFVLHIGRTWGLITFSCLEADRPFFASEARGTLVHGRTSSPTNGVQWLLIPTLLVDQSTATRGTQKRNHVED